MEDARSLEEEDMIWSILPLCYTPLEYVKEYLICGGVEEYRSVGVESRCGV